MHGWGYFLLFTCKHYKQITMLLHAGSYMNSNFIAKFHPHIKTLGAHALRGLQYKVGLFVCLSVCPSVRPSYRTTGYEAANDGF